MSRWYLNKKDTVESCKSISTTFLKKHGYFCRWASGGMKWTNGSGEQTGSIGFRVTTREWDGEIQFQYTQTDAYTQEKTELDYPVRLSATPCHYGNKRWWFICPLVRSGAACGRRVLNLYLGDKHFGCRHCFNLTYRSVQEHDKRIDSFLRNPGLLLNATRNPNDLGMNLIALKALFKLEEKEERKRKR